MSGSSNETKEQEAQCNIEKEEEEKLPPLQASFQIGKGKSLIYAHALAWPPHFGKHQSHYSVEALVNYWNVHPPQHIVYKTFGQVVLETIMDSNSAPLFAEGLIHHELQKKIIHDKMYYNFEFCSAPILWQNTFFTFHALSRIFANDFDSVPIQKYMQVTEILSTLNGTERTYAIYVLEKFVGGDITKLAEVSECKNIQYIMSRLKLANAVPLLHAVFSSPTWTGKITSIIRLIELYDVLWKGINWEAVQNFAEFLFTCFDWLMRQTRMIKDFAAAGFEWVHVKVDDMKKKYSKPKEHDATAIATENSLMANKQSSPIRLCVKCNSADLAVGCSICKSHLCMSCVDTKELMCMCPKSDITLHICDVENSINECDCDNDQDCLFRAVAQGMKIPYLKLKQDLCRALNQPDLMTIYEAASSLVDETACYLSWVDFKDEILRQLCSNMMCDEQMAWWITIVKKVALTVEKEMENPEGQQQMYTFGFYPPDATAKSIVIRLENFHFTLQEDHLLTNMPDFYLWGQVYNYNNFKAAVDANGKFKEKYRPPISEEKNENMAQKKNFQPGVSEVPMMVNADQLIDLSDSGSEISEEDCESLSSGASSVLSDLQVELKKYKKLSDDSISQRTTNDGTDDEDTLNAKDENAQNEQRSDESFWDLLKDFRWHQIGCRVVEWFKKCSSGVLEWFQNNPLFTGLISLLIGIASFFGISVTCFTGDVSSLSILKKFTDATRSMYYAERGMSAISKAFGTTIDAAKDILGISKNSTIDEFKQEIADAHDLATKMLSIASHTPGQFINDANNFQNFKKNMELIGKTYKNLAAVASTKELNTIAPIWHALNRTYEKLHLTFNKMMSCAMTRQEPVVTYLYGKTGLGKSTLVAHLINTLNTRLKKTMATFTISHGPEYWNGYAQQDIIRIDDMNAVITQEGDTDSIALFNLATNAPFNPNMANLDDKNIMATPKFIFVCSNHPSVPSNSCIQRRDAWERRRDVFVHVTWPGHENCPISTKNCPCWIKMEKDKFDHLRLTLCDPIVSHEATPAPKGEMGKNMKGYMQSNYVIKSDKEIIEAGEVIDVDKMLQLIIGKEYERRMDFERRLKESVLAGSIQQAASWETNPTALILGPPGTGKSHILKRYQELKPHNKLFMLKTLEEFEAFVTAGFKSTEPSVILFNDLSLIVQSKNFPRLVERLQERYDEDDANQDFWILCANEHVLNTALLKIDDNEEFLQLVYRRCEVFRTSWKKKSSIKEKVKSFCKNVSPFYNVNDIKDKTLMDQYVQYQHNGENITQETAIRRLSVMKPVVRDVVVVNSLSKAKELPITCVFELDLTAEQFCDTVNNMAVMKIFSLIRNGKVKIVSGKIKPTELITKLQKIVNDTKGLEGTNFDTIEDLLLQAWNKDLLKAFEGDCIVLKLKDKMYYINALKPQIECGIFETTLDCVKQCVEELKMTVETIEVSDLMEVRSILPHWFVVAGECIATIFASAVTGCSSVFSVLDQMEMFKAQRFVIGLNEVLDTGVSRAQESITAKVENALYKGTSTPFYPGMKNIKKPQYADITTDTLFMQNVSNDSKVDRGVRVYRREDNASNEPRRPINPRVYRRENVSNQPKSDHGRIGYMPRREEDYIEEYVYDDPLPAQRNGVSLETITFNCAFETIKKNKIEKSVKKEFEKKENVTLNKEICSDPQLYTIIDRMLKNMVEIITISGHRLCSGLLVRGRCIRTVSHLLDTHKVNNLRARTLDGRTWPIKLIEENTVYDRADFQVTDDTFPMAADITSHFPSLDNTIAEGATAVLVTPDINFLKEVVVVAIRPYVVKNQKIHNFRNYNLGLYAIEYSGHRNGYKITGVETKYGDCGSLLIMLDNSWQDGKVIGMHVAGAGNNGYASPLRKEQYLDKIKFQSSNEMLSEKYFEPVQREDPNLIAVCKINNHVPSKTKLYKNWYPIGPKLYEPAILSSKDTRGNGRSLLRDESLKWCVKREGLTSEVRKDLEDCMREFALQYVSVFKKKGVVLRKLTSTEALNKLKGSNCSEPINTHSSAGFPFAKLTTCPGKNAYISTGENGERRFNKDPRSIQAVQFLQEEMNKLEHEIDGRHSDVIFLCYLKDELRKLERIYKNPKTRTIAAAPLHFIIVFRKYFYAAHVAMMENWELIGPKIGISPTSLDWHVMFSNLLSVSTHGIDLDFSGWDFSHDPFIISLIPMFYKILYEELDPNLDARDQAVRDCLYSKILNFKFLVGNDLYRSTGGIPSGYPGTSPDNSVINEFLHYYIYKKIMRTSSPAHANLTSFREDVAIATYGDDVITAISFWASKFYNGITLKEEFEKLHFKPQAADKEGEIVPIKPLKDCIFLARRFQFKYGIWMAPLKYENLCKPTHYSQDRRSHLFWESPDEEIQAVDIVQNVYESLLYNAAIDSLEVYKTFREIAEKVMAETNGPELPSYEDALQRMYGFPIEDKSKHIEGIELIDMSQMLNLNWQHPLPPHYAKFSNRISYSFGPIYHYTGAPKANKMTKQAQKIIDYVNLELGKEYNSLLVNIYPIGGEIPFHKDSEPELDMSQGVFGVTMKGDGYIEFKNSRSVNGFYLDPGIGYMMDEFNLGEYFHRRYRHYKETITFTFRKLVPRV